MRKRYRIAEMKPLPEVDREKLANAAVGHGNMLKVTASTDLTATTIRRAVAGFRLTPPVYKAIRGFLSPKAAKPSPRKRRTAQTVQP